MFLKVGKSTWLNTETITRVDVIEARTESTRLNVWTLDPSRVPVTITEETEVENFLAWLNQGQSRKCDLKFHSESTQAPTQNPPPVTVQQSAKKNAA